jgi:hypothetical protein
MARFDLRLFLITINFNDRVRADNRAHSTACTIGIVYLRREIAVLVGVLRNDDAILRTYHHAQAATFAPFGINYYFTDHFRISHLSQNPDEKILPSASIFVKQKGN